MLWLSRPPRWQDEKNAAEEGGGETLGLGFHRLTSDYARPFRV